MIIVVHGCKLIINFRSFFKRHIPVPSYYTVILESLDGLKHNLVMNITMERIGEMIDIRMEEVLPSKSLWKASTQASWMWK